MTDMELEDFRRCPNRQDKETPLPMIGAQEDIKTLPRMTNIDWHDIALRVLAWREFRGLRSTGNFCKDGSRRTI